MMRSAAHAHGAELVRRISAAFLFMFLHGSAAAEPSGRVWIDTGAIVPYSFCRATISGPDGLSGFARLYGIAPDGSRTALFGARFGRLESIEALFYADPRFLWLGFEGMDGSGDDVVASLRLGPSLPDAAHYADTDASILAALPFPFRTQPFRGPPTEFASSDTSPEALARAAVSRLFAPRKSAWPLVTLSAWSMLVLALAARGRRDASAMAAFVAGSFLATAALASSAGDTPELYSIAAREREIAVVRSVQRRATYDEVTWRDKAAIDEGSGGVRFVALRSPLSAAIPVSALARYRRLRFADPPLVLRRIDGTDVLAPARFSAAWGLHD